jgi:FkbM family methyltransferase
MLDVMMRNAAATVLRHAPEIRGRGRVAGFINKRFRARENVCVVVAPMRLNYEMLVDLRSATESYAYYTGDYDTNDLRAVRSLIQSGWNVLDVGANIGFWTIPMALSLRGVGRLHAFEPVKANLKRLGENVLRNELSTTVQLHSVGLSDREEAVWISKRGDFGTGSSTGNAAIVIDSDDDCFAREQIEIAPLDGRIFDSLGLGRLDFIKVDIEGHEDRFLAGASEVIRRYRPIIYMEINEPFYTRRGLDPTRIFGQWMNANCYKAALSKGLKWKLGEICHRKPVIDNVFLIPAERSEEVVRLMAAGGV